jgi:hypothetical protein
MYLCSVQMKKNFKKTYCTIFKANLTLWILRNQIVNKTFKAVLAQMMINPVLTNRVNLNKLPETKIINNHSINKELESEILIKGVVAR